jgi:SAM-dependent methyltransferase
MTGDFSPVEEVRAMDMSGGVTVTEVRSLEALRFASAMFESLNTRPRSPQILLHEVASALHTVASALVECERDGVERAFLLEVLEPLRRLHARSPFVRRLQTWPRGYAGDFETVEWLCDATNRAEPGTTAWAIEEYALQSPIAQQHRNKVAMQAHAILAALSSAGRRARIASLGCGGCRDLSVVQDCAPDCAGSFVLVDTDLNALDFARRRLHSLTATCEFVPGNVPRVLTNVASKGPFDLVVAGGLFDYLPDRWAIATLRAAYRMLRPGGKLLFSNIAEGNPFRVWIEYLADWRLIERCEADVRNLVAAADIDCGGMRIDRDASRLALMIELTR